MDLEIIGRHTEITPDMREYIVTRLDKLPKFFGRIHALKAVFSVDGLNHQAEFVAHLVKGDTVVAKADARDIYTAIDAAAAKLESRLRRYKDRLSEHRVKAETAEPPTPPAGEEETAEQAEQPEEELTG